MRRVLRGAVVGLLLATTASAQGRTQILGSSVESRAVSGTVAREVQQIASARPSVWIGYRVATVPMRGDWCADNARPTRIALEPQRAVTVLARFEAATLTELRTVTDYCDVDAAGVPAVWLDGVTADASAAWLASLIRTDGNARNNRRIAERAMSALAWHDSALALNGLIDIARADPNRDLRSKSLFWLAQRAGQQAVAAISNALQNDPEVEVKKKAVFALSQLPADQGVPLLIQVARTHQSGEVRKQAMFWLGQSRDERALSFFEEVLRR